MYLLVFSIKYTGKKILQKYRTSHGKFLLEFFASVYLTDVYAFSHEFLSTADK